MKSLLPPVFTIAFSGHRPKSQEKGRSSAELDGLVESLTKVFVDLRSRIEAMGGEAHLVCSLAAGSDVVACDVADSLGIPVHVVLPKVKERFLADDFDGEAEVWRDRVQGILSRFEPGAEDLVDTSHGWTCRHIEGTQESPDCYLATNVFILEACDVVVTVWNGGSSAPDGGTGHVVAQAEVLKLPRIVVDPATHGIDRSGDHFDPTKASGLEVFNSLGKHLTCPVDDRGTLFEGVSSCLGEAADLSSKSFRNSTKRAIIFHAAAGFLAALAASFYAMLKSDFYEISYLLLAGFSVVEFVLVGWGCYLEFYVGRSHVQRTWLDCRLAREVMRGLENSTPFLDPLLPEIKRDQPRWERFGVTCSLLKQASQRPLNAASRDHVLAARDKYLSERIDSQLKFFVKEQQSASSRSLWFKRIAHLSGPAALVVVFLACLAKITLVFTHGDGWSEFFSNSWLNAGVFLFLPILLPLLASLSAFFFVWFDFGRRSTRYTEMIEALERKKNWIMTLEHVSVIAPEVRRTERLLLQENIEWMASQKAGLGH